MAAGGMDVAGVGTVAGVAVLVVGTGVVVAGVVVGGRVRVVDGTVEVVGRTGMVVDTGRVGRVSVVVGSCSAAAVDGRSPYPSNETTATAARHTRPVRRPAPRRVGSGCTRPISAGRFSFCIGQLVVVVAAPDSGSNNKKSRHSRTVIGQSRFN